GQLDAEDVVVVGIAGLEELFNLLLDAAGLGRVAGDDDVHGSEGRRVGRRFHLDRKGERHGKGLLTNNTIRRDQSLGRRPGRRSSYVCLLILRTNASDVLASATSDAGCDPRVPAGRRVTRDGLWAAAGPSQGAGGSDSEGL